MKIETSNELTSILEKFKDNKKEEAKLITDLLSFINKLDKEVEIREVK